MITIVLRGGKTIPAEAIAGSGDELLISFQGWHTLIRFDDIYSITRGELVPLSAQLKEENERLKLSNALIHHEQAKLTEECNRLLGIIENHHLMPLISPLAPSDTAFPRDPLMPRWAAFMISFAVVVAFLMAIVRA